MKLGWQLVTNKDSFWARVVRDKYKCGDDLIPKINTKRHGSNVWLGIKKTWEKVYDGLELVAGKNEVRWKWETNGLFSVKSAYDSLKCGRSMGVQQWDKIWKVKAPQKCRSLVWLAAHEALLTNEDRYNRGLVDDSRCTICGHYMEDMNHVFRECPSSKQLWQVLLPNSERRNVNSLNFSDWLWYNLNKKHGINANWPAIFVVACWMIWRYRNLFIFEQKKIHIDAMKATIMGMMESFTVTREKLSGSNIDGASKWQVFWYIIFPMLKPISVTVGILNIIWIWNDYLLPSLVLGAGQETIPLKLFFFFGQYTKQWHLALAGLTLAIIPIIIFYFISEYPKVLPHYLATILPKRSCFLDCQLLVKARLAPQR